VPGARAPAPRHSTSACTAARSRLAQRITMRVK